MSLRRITLLCGATLASTSGAATTTFPQTVEVDLIFPRNETYSPSAIFPIVFAFQNPALIPGLDPGFDINLWQNVEHNTTILFPEIGHLSGVNFSNATGPLYVYTFATNLNTTSNGADAATRYNLVWAFSAGNCSADGGGSSGDETALGGGWVSSNVIFTIAQSGGAAPEIADTSNTNNTSCADLSHLAFNLTGTLAVPDPSKWDGHSTCAVFSNTKPTPVGNPCAATADASVAASISAAATSNACAAVSPAISCPPAKKSGAVRTVSSSWGMGLVAVGTAGAWAMLLLAAVL